MGGRKIIPFKRKRQGRTNYKKRLTLLKSKKLRLVVRKTNKQILIQIVKYEPDGDKIICGVNSSSLKKQGWKYGSFSNFSNYKAYFGTRLYYSF